MHEEIAKLVDRSGERGDYYAALDLQHFGASPSASNFVDFASVEEGLAACWEARGSFDGNDRDALLKAGATEDALLNSIGCRYLMFPARGRLGVAEIEDLPGDVRIELVLEKPGTPLSLVVAKVQTNAVHIERPEVDFGTAIIGTEGVLWTMHPGLPIRPKHEPAFEFAGFVAGATFLVSTLVDAQSESGVALRKVFADKDVEFPEVRRVKVPA
jgi:hypothetical protein